MSRNYKNILKLRNKAFGYERRENLTKEIVKDSTPLPKPVVYEDIDAEMHKWVDEKLSISFDENRLPTMGLFSNQRFSEYLQSWKFVDSNNNLILNFKTLSRENNPQIGTINGETKNIPGEPYILLKREIAKDKNDRPYFIDYKVKQPMPIDLKYRVGIMTNKYELINEFNLIVNNEFKAITAYIRPKGHFMSMILDSISDESEYNIDDRQFYSQVYDITVRAYIIPEFFFSVEEKPMLHLMSFDGVKDEDRMSVEIEDMSQPCPVNNYYYQAVKITAVAGECCEKIKFTIDCNFTIQFIKVNQNIRSFRLFINDDELLPFSF